MKLKTRTYTIPEAKSPKGKHLLALCLKFLDDLLKTRQVLVSHSPRPVYFRATLRADLSIFEHWPLQKRPIHQSKIAALVRVGIPSGICVD